MDTLQRVMKKFETERTCKSGHPMDPAHKFCPECGKPPLVLTETQKMKRFFELAQAEVVKKTTNKKARPQIGNILNKKVFERRPK